MSTDSKRAARILVSMIATGLAAWLSAQHACAELADTYKDYLKNGQQARDVEVLKSWASRFEIDLAKAGPKDPAFYHGLVVLGDLYDRIGDRAASLKARETVFRAVDAPSQLRLQAGIAILFVKDRINTRPTELLTLGREVRELFASSDLGPSRPAFVAEMRMIDFKIAQWTIAAGKAQSEQTSTQGQTARAEDVRIASLRQAAEELDRYLEGWPSLSSPDQSRLLALNYGPAAGLYLRGEIDQALGSLAAGRGDREAATDDFKRARGFLNKLLDEFPKHPVYSQPAAVLLLQIKEWEGTNQPDYVDYVKGLLSRVAPGHTVINHLTDVSTGLAAGRTRDLANTMFDLVLDREQAWFPAEYRGHINYQVALLESTVNLIGSGDLKAADSRLSLLKETPIKDPFLVKRRDEVAQIYARTFDAAPASVKSPASRRFMVIYANVAILGLVALAVLARQFRRRREREV